ncbi:MAG: EF2563 family selenium-dependent molybdenum hydroxylase system protein [Chloroflexi bacterium]|nr:MAG: EF2563 family selenium-dependent molybdenum hydroxylase system protein [Chloroflexota bacterium]
MSKQDKIQLPLIAVKGAGDLATGVIHRLTRAGFAVLATELPQPTVLRRTVAFAEAITSGQMTVEGIAACRADSVDTIQGAFARGLVPVVVDPDGVFLKEMQPGVLVEATLSKRNSGITMHDAPIVIALGPGYEAGKDAHAVIETNRGHNLGRVYLQGCAEPNTGVPGTIGGYTGERLLRAPCAGTLYGLRKIGDQVQAGETVAVVKFEVEASPVIAAISGILRGLVRDGLPVHAGMKVGDIDPRAKREHCFTISDKSRAVAGGVLEAVMYFLKSSKNDMIIKKQEDDR